MPRSRVSRDSLFFLHVELFKLGIVVFVCVLVVNSSFCVTDAASWLNSSNVQNLYIRALTYYLLLVYGVVSILYWLLIKHSILQN